MATYSTREAAKQLGIHFITLHRYILDKKVPAPKVQVAGGVKFRVWGKSDIERVREILPTIANGRKTRHKKQSAFSNQQSAKRSKTQARAPALQPNKKKK